METPFYKTRMGQSYYEHTAPELVRQLARLNDLLERLLVVQERGRPETDGGHA